MEPLLILTGVAVLFYSANRISQLPTPANKDQQIAWQADLHYETAVKRLKETIRTEKQALKNPKARSLLASTTDIRSHLQALESSLGWLQGVAGTYQNLVQSSTTDSKYQHKLLNDWRQFTDALWGLSNNDQWQQVYMEHGLAVDDNMSENAQAYGLKAEQVADRLFSRVRHA